jgi:hypothetical protein
MSSALRRRKSAAVLSFLRSLLFAKGGSGKRRITPSGLISRTKRLAVLDEVHTYTARLLSIGMATGDASFSLLESNPYSTVT